MKIELKKETEQDLQQYLLEQGLEPDALSDVVDTIVQEFLFMHMLNTAAARNSDLDAEEAERLIYEVIKEDRQKQREKKTKK